MTERLIVLALVVVVCSAVFWRMWDDIAEAAEPDWLAFLDDDGLVEIPLPAGWRAGEVWDTLAWIEALPEFARV